ncbi:TIGR03757 family integrating conjugative element protein [Conservatibacter flavescens]|uniref:TIGR03757 family integrating conjugative element protein n=1 Tax=Conservatibacter flavescens TaxID=28161 RepID=A0A2M8S0Z0_9PAST|nr:TIGR03757 family integrating conjugative element protein [Conservatibacter flavescens]PJG84821.1 TIGR03757 family integrating conjugative element protein [Conservatibacter flavescens]
MLKRILTLSLLLSSPIFAEQTSPVQIFVFSTHTYPIQNQSLAHFIYQLDDVEKWEEQFSHTLSADPKLAEQQAKAIFQTQEVQNSLKELQHRYQGVIHGWQNGIRKVPAILFESPHFGNSVIYGVNDVQQALSLWENWVKQQKQEK